MFNTFVQICSVLLYGICIIGGVFGFIKFIDLIIMHLRRADREPKRPNYIDYSRVKPVKPYSEFRKEHILDNIADAVDSLKFQMDDLHQLLAKHFDEDEEEGENG